ncbi:MAG: transglycosylase SLT domain-containing protein [Terriglobia bacterium]
MQRIWSLSFAVLLALAVAVFATEKGEDPSAQLARYAQALSARPTSQAYRRLQLFAEQHRGTELGAQAALRLGWTDFEKQRWERGEQHFTHAAASQLLGDYGHFYWAQAQRGRGALELALATLEEFHRRHRESPLTEAAMVAQAAVLVELGRTDQASSLLSRQPDWQRRPALLLARAEAQAAAGETPQAVETLHRLYYEFPLSLQAEPANQLLNQLRPQLATRYVKPSEELRRKRANLLWAAQAYQGARSAYVDLSVRASEPTRRLARLRAAQAFYQLGGGSRACEELEAIRDVDPELEAEWRAYRIRCRLRAQDVAGFERELEDLRTRFPGSRWYAQALFAAGSYFLATDEFACAADHFQRLLARFPKSAWAAEAQWKLAWIAYLEQDTARAAQRMEKHLARFPNSPFTPRALYWRARIAARRGKVSVAARLVELLRSHFPRHYLAQQVGQAEWAQVLAGAGDGEENSGSVPAWVEALRLTRSVPDTPSLAAGPARLLERARTLEQLGLVEFAAEEAAFVLKESPQPEAYLIRARVALVRKHYPQAIEAVRRGFPDYLDMSLDALPRATWELLFPRLYWRSIQRHARRYKLDPYLVAAVMRQESRFDAQAVSSAGARGLMQLMPRTARRLARVRRLKPDRLFQPDFNIRLGTRFLRELRRRFKGQLELMVAAYNAGGTRVSQWHRRRKWSEPAEFVESIPATQTRNFVYLVLRNYQFYRDLYTTD